MALGAFTEVRKESPREREVDVIDAGTDHRRPHPPEDLANTGMRKIEDRPLKEPDRAKRRPLRDDLKEAANERRDHDRKRRVDTGFFERPGKKERPEEKGD